MLICPELLTPHLNKLTALARNSKLPAIDVLKVVNALERYKGWVTAMNRLEGEGEILLSGLVDLLNQYKRYIEIDLIYDSEADFLYRQKGQHKVDNS